MLPTAAASHTRHWADQRGFTLVEALIAIVILIIGIVSLYTMQIGAIHGNATANSLSNLSSEATNRIEGILADASGITDTELEDKARGDGTNCINSNGVPSGNQCGLNNPLTASGAEPNYQSLGWNCSQYTGWDDCRPAADGNGLVFLNFADDVPMPGIITIRVKTVTMNLGQPVVTTITYFKRKLQ